MSGNPEQPLGGTGNVYDSQFADRIANISRGGGGGGGGKGTGSGSRGGWGAGAGVAIVVMILLRVVLAGSRGCSDRDRPYTYTPPPIDRPILDKDGWNEGARDWAKQDADIARALAGMAGLDPQRDYRLKRADIVFAPGLCREIMEDTEKPGSTPGKRIYASLDALGKGLVRNFAGAREVGPADGAALAAVLDRVLSSMDFYDVGTFRTVPRPELKGKMAALWDGLQPPANKAEARELNRRALEAAYPLHIVSCDIGSDERSKRLRRLAEFQPLLDQEREGEGDRTQLRKRLADLQRRLEQEGGVEDDRALLLEQLKAEHEEALRKKGR